MTPSPVIVFARNKHMSKTMVVDDEDSTNVATVTYEPKRDVSADGNEGDKKRKSQVSFYEEVN